ncbi:MAG: cytochrome c [Verrucomicrobia bacterium]|nr:cytochrome c [Verrucomicrobiota bacterium]
MKPNFIPILGGAAVMIVAAALLLAAGCSTLKSGTSAPAAGPKAGASASGAQLWAQNCGHCHNIRSPGMYSDAQWEVIMLHMRIRGNLTATEHKEILAFLRSAH